MVIKNDDYLLHLLFCSLNDCTPEEIPQELSFEKVFENGAEHEVANIAYPSVLKLKNKPDDALLNKWKEKYLQSVVRDTQQAKARKEILDALHKHCIYTLEVQGTIVKKYYPKSYMRMMSDIDIIVPFEKFNELEAVMNEIGYQTEVNSNEIEIQAKKDNIHIELHTEFFNPDNVTHTALNTPFSYATLNNDYNAVVSDTVFYLFHLLHTIKHTIDVKGSGIRRIVDLFYLENTLAKQVDYKYIDDVLQKFGFYDTKLKLLAVKDHWFNSIEPKIDVAELENEILEAGNHGTKDIYYKNKFKRERSEGKRFIKLKYFIGFVFPTKKEIYKFYPFCEKHRYPLLLCWIHRWIFSIFNIKKWKNVKNVFRRMKRS